MGSKNDNLLYNDKNAHKYIILEKMKEANSGCKLRRALKDLRISFYHFGFLNISS